MKQKVVLITGASSGIGEQCVKKFLDNNYTVYACARRQDRMKYLSDLGANIISLDITLDESMTDCISYIYSKEENIDVLINCAGYGLYGALEDISIDEAKKQFDVNVFGLARMTQLVLPKMRKYNKGKIVNISSIAGKIHMPLGAWYHSSKFAIEGLSDCLRAELRDFNIDVMLIEPGIIKTEWSDITIDNLSKASAHGGYKHMAETITKSMNLAYSNKDNHSTAESVAKVVLNSVLAKKPKARYSVGKMSYILLLRKYLSDSLFDKIIRWNLNKFSR